MAKIIDPYSEELPEDYIKTIKDFGLEEFKADSFPNPNRLMRRGLVFSGRDLEQIKNAIKQKKKFYALSGIMPSAEKIHLGTKMVIDNIRYFQEHGAITYCLVADLESACTRSVTLEEAQKRALQFHIPAYIALGLDPKKTIFYFQSENKEVIHLAYEFAKKITLNEFKAIYGSADPGRIMAAVTQVGDILYPQLKERMPGIIPVGLDQDPHVRLSRDIVSRTKAKYNFFAPSSMYHKFTPSLDGSMKMSKSKPESTIDLPDSAENVCRKIMKAMSGGRDTLEEHRKKGAVLEKDMAFQLLKIHLEEDDAKLKKLQDDYAAGKLTSGEVKQIACEKMTAFLERFNKNLEKARKNVDELDFIRS